MKKTNLLKGALSVLAVSVLLASCTQVDSRIDTVDTLETPSVKAVAYPGVNYISWNAVKGAVGYKVSRTVDGEAETIFKTLNKDVLCVKDSLSINDVDVEYKVYALSDSNPSSTRSVYVYNSNAGSASVTNIFPPVGTKAIDLPKYEKDSGWDFDEGADNKDWKDDFIPTAENIKVQLVDGAIHVTAPTKAYLTTRVVGYTGNKEEIFYYDYPTRTEREFDTYQNKTSSLKSVITSAGEYKFKATVNALGEWYRNAYYGETIFALNTTITIPAVKTSKGTSNITVKYIDDAQTIARVQFEPAVSADGKEVFALTDYKVYRALSGTSNLEEVKDLKKDSITIGGKTTDVYVVDDTVPANNVAYDYYVVLSKDGEFEEDIEPKTLLKADIDSASIGDINLSDFAVFGDDKLENDVVANVKPSEGSSKIVSVAYAYSTSDDSDKVLDSAYKPLVVVPELAEIGQAFLIENVPENNYVFVKAEFAEIKSTGKVNSVRVERTYGKYTVGKANGIEINISNPSQKKGDTDLLLNDWIGNEINVNGGELVSVKYGVAKNKELAKVAAINGIEVTFKVKDYDKGKYDYDYTFDITDKGVVGQYIAIAAEVKAEGKTNKLIFKASDYPVSVNNTNLPLSIVSSPTTVFNDKTSKYDTSLKVDISKFISKENNAPSNYDSVEISYIETNAKYEITNEEDWSDVKTIKFIDFDKDENTSGTNYSKTHNLISKSYSNTATESVTKYYVIKTVTKYNVPGAEDREYYETVPFTYYK